MIKPRVVLAHDWLVGLRGGEWVLDRLARLYGPTTIYTLVNDYRFLTEAIDRCEVVCSPLQRLPGANGKWRRHYLPFYPWAVEKIHVDEPCDILISTSSAAIKNMAVPPGVPHLCYCHSPARYIWEQRDDYSGGKGGLIRRFGLMAVSNRFQDWDREGAQRVTRFLANSRHTAARIKRCWNCEATVVYPPVRTDYFTPNDSTPREDWFLVVSALEPYKKADTVARAAMAGGWRVKIAGRGSQHRYIQKLGGRSNGLVSVLGYVSDEKLRDLYRRARALIFPQVEDFGIIAAEAQACGCPVIAYAMGGAIEIVPEGCGILFDRQTEQGVVDAVRAFNRETFDPDKLRANAERFSGEAFDAAIRREVNDLVG